MKENNLPDIGTVS